MSRRVILDAAQSREVGIDPVDTAITLPDGFETFTPAQRRQWARREIEATVKALLADMAAARSIVPTSVERDRYLAVMRPRIDASLAGLGHE